MLIAIGFPPEMLIIIMLLACVNECRQITTLTL
ncbi:hypothetical protein BCE_0429 [Bacillus cereus ATCC 10987]|uniref:Uncharacterized protein n=1 Tax=Bacillus cereus (strain ATCC 10987 / NRS 248) TaxID=222523 RepID=Q73EC9_BACC1|nr:hypothetical protein BCE_0429 [Bacillus cereus ATCC 10987]